MFLKLTGARYTCCVLRRYYFWGVGGAEKMEQNSSQTLAVHDGGSKHVLKLFFKKKYLENVVVMGVIRENLPWK